MTKSYVVEYDYYFDCQNNLILEAGLYSYLIEQSRTAVTITFLATSIELFDNQIDVKIPSDKRISKDEYYKKLLQNSPLYFCLKKMKIN